MCEVPARLRHPQGNRQVGGNQQVDDQQVDDQQVDIVRRLWDCADAGCCRKLPQV